MTRPRAAVFLDRDGVINELALNPATGEWESPHAVADVRLCAGSAGSIGELRAASFLVLLVSNQPSAAKGKCTLADLHAVHARVLDLLAAGGAAPDGSYVCHHHPLGVVADLTGPCACRKPEPGLLFKARAEWDVDLGSSWMVGDRESDIECGRRAGCRTILVQSSQTIGAGAGSCRPDHVVSSLAEATGHILKEVRAHACR